TQISLQPLAPEESLHIVKSVLGVDEASDALYDLIVAKAEGNPFFVEELARTVREQIGGAAPMTVPDTVEEVLGGRIDRLAAEERRLHARITEAIERLYPTRLADHVERLAHHAFEGEAWAKAHAYLHQAGTKAYSRCAHQEAAACFDRALAALGRLPESRERTERVVDLRFDLRNTLQPLGEFERILECLREAETLAR